MDPSILPLFSADEIMLRLAQRKSTGCFKVFTSLDSATVFFKKGMIVAAAKGKSDGETALREILQWKDAFFAWEPDIVAPIPPLRPVLIKVDAFLVKIDNPVAKTSVTGISITNGKNSASPIQPGEGATSRTATKSITATAETRIADEEALLRKHRLKLISVSNPEKKFKLTKATSLIGRNPGSDIMVADPSISRQHCLLQLTDRGLHVKDLNTVNGTKINGIPLKEGYVNIGDKLTVGHLTFVVEEAKQKFS